MKTSELIEALSKFDPNLPVMISFPEADSSDFEVNQRLYYPSWGTFYPISNAEVGKEPIPYVVLESY